MDTLYDINWKDVIRFDFERAFSVIRGLKIPLEPVVEGEESKIPESIYELQYQLTKYLEKVIYWINRIYPSENPVSESWVFGPFLFIFTSHNHPQLTIAFAPVMIETDTVAVKDEE